MLIAERDDESGLTEGVQKTMKRQLHKDFPGGYARRKNQASNFQELQSRRSKERIGLPSPTHACCDNHEPQNIGENGDIITSIDDMPWLSGGPGVE
jgi:hypothetical protein